MVETFYTALGVDADADEQAVRDAYRECVKERHPDVSDDPDAPGEFKRLTTARDVLVDEAERERYDRLGHDTYVRRHLPGGAWASDAAPSGTDDRAGGKPQTGSRRRDTATRDRGAHRTRNPNAEGDADDRRAWLGEDWEPPTSSGTSAAAGGATTGGGGSTSDSWYTASEAYRYTPTEVPSKPSGPVSAIRRLVATVGPWLVVHLVFLAASIGVAWLLYARLVAMTQLPVLAAAVGVLLVGLTLVLSSLHVVSLAYG